MSDKETALWNRSSWEGRRASTCQVYSQARTWRCA